MSDQSAPESQAHASVGNEPDVVATGQLSLWILVVLAVSVVGILGIRSVVYREAAAQREAKSVAGTGHEVQALRAKMNEKLSGYGVADAKRGLYRIPIDRAMDIVAARPGLVRRVPGAPAPKPPPPPAGGGATGQPATAASPTGASGGGR